MLTRLGLCLTAILIFAGCVPSLHSIVTEKTLTYDPALIGRWQADDDVWTITGDAENQSYIVEIVEDGRQSKLTAHLVELQGHPFLDMTAEDGDQLNTGEWFAMHVLPVHNFWKIKKRGDGFVVYDMKYETVKWVIQDKPETVKHEVVDNDRIVLTDSAENLQRFLIAGLTIEDFYVESFELKPAR